jgi:hypothetical protein
MNPKRYMNQKDMTELPREATIERERNRTTLVRAGSLALPVGRGTSGIVFHEAGAVEGDLRANHDSFARCDISVLRCVSADGRNDRCPPSVPAPEVGGPLISGSDTGLNKVGMTVSPRKP